MARSARPRHGGVGMKFEVIRHVVIRGRVQGVGYRAFAEYTALDHGLEGWVRNRRDGAVEAVFAGPVEAVTAMVEAGPRGAPGARGRGVRGAPGEAPGAPLCGAPGFSGVWAALG